MATASPHLTNPLLAASSAYIFLAVSASSFTRLGGDKAHALGLASCPERTFWLLPFTCGCR